MIWKWYERREGEAMVARHDALRPDAVWELKAQAPRKNNLLTLHRGDDKFDALGGLARAGSSG